ILGTPTYMADVSGRVKSFLESLKQYGLAGKLGGAFATADYIHGGGDIAIQTILTHMMVYGMMVYSGGGSCGKPVIHLGPVAIKGYEDELKNVFEIYGQRMAEQTLRVFEK
ncbi:MAG: flavodoxin family protein, partial [Lachnospirales bacterium]